MGPAANRAHFGDQPKQASAVSLINRPGDFNGWQVQEPDRPRADPENVFDELKHAWGFRGFCAKSRAPPRARRALLLRVDQPGTLFGRLDVPQTGRGQTRATRGFLNHRRSRPIRPAEGHWGLDERRLGPTLAGGFSAFPRADTSPPHCAAVKMERARTGVRPGESSAGRRLNPIFQPRIEG